MFSVLIFFSLGVSRGVSVVMWVGVASEFELVKCSTIIVLSEVINCILTHTYCSNAYPVFLFIVFL